VAGGSAPPPPPKPHTQGSGSAVVNTMNSAHVPGQEASTAGGKSADNSALGEGHRETGGPGLRDGGAPFGQQGPFALELGDGGVASGQRGQLAHAPCIWPSLTGRFQEGAPLGGSVASMKAKWIGFFNILVLKDLQTACKARAVSVDQPKNKQNYVDALVRWAALEGQGLAERRVRSHLDSGHGDFDGSHTLGRDVDGAEQARPSGFIRDSREDVNVNSSNLHHMAQGVPFGASVGGATPSSQNLSRSPQWAQKSCVVHKGIWRQADIFHNSGPGLRRVRLVDTTFVMQVPEMAIAFELPLDRAGSRWRVGDPCGAYVDSLPPAQKDLPPNLGLTITLTNFKELCSWRLPSAIQGPADAARDLSFNLQQLGCESVVTFVENACGVTLHPTHPSQGPNVLHTLNWGYTIVPFTLSEVQRCVREAADNGTLQVQGPSPIAKRRNTLDSAGARGESLYPDVMQRSAPGFENVLRGGFAISPFGDRGQHLGTLPDTNGLFVPPPAYGAQVGGTNSGGGGGGGLATRPSQLSQDFGTAPNTYGLFSPPLGYGAQRWGPTSGGGGRGGLAERPSQLFQDFGTVPNACGLFNPPPGYGEQVWGANSYGEGSGGLVARSSQISRDVSRFRAHGGPGEGEGVQSDLLLGLCDMIRMQTTALGSIVAREKDPEKETGSHSKSLRAFETTPLHDAQLFDPKTPKDLQAPQFMTTASRIIQQKPGEPGFVGQTLLGEYERQQLADISERIRSTSPEAGYTCFLEFMRYKYEGLAGEASTNALTEGRSPAACPVVAGYTQNGTRLLLAWKELRVLLSSPMFTGLPQGAPVPEVKVTIALTHVVKTAIGEQLSAAGMRTHVGAGFAAPQPDETIGTDGCGHEYYPSSYMPGQIQPRMLPTSVSQSQMPAGTPVGMSRVPRKVGESFPTSTLHISPFGFAKIGMCNHCRVAGHEYFECPLKFHAQWGIAMPGFDQLGNRLPNYWHLNNEKYGPSQEVAAAWCVHTWTPGPLLGKDRHRGSQAKPPAPGDALWDGWRDASMSRPLT